MIIYLSPEVIVFYYLNAYAVEVPKSGIREHLYARFMMEYQNYFRNFN